MSLSVTTERAKDVKPCIFCGEKEDLWRTWYSEPDRAFIACGQCGAQGPTVLDSEPDTAEYGWNVPWERDL